jgi:RND superfamily putative drug exporter
VRVEQFGEVSATKAIEAQDAKDGKRAQLLSNVLMLIILLVAFGAVVAAGLPLVLGASAVAAAVGLVGPISHLYALPADVAELMVIIGLAVGVDYAMFYSRRVMEERDRGHSAEDAVAIAAGTSGRAVLISGMTVMTAMAGLLFAGNPIFVGFGIGTMLVVAVAMLASLTFLPAMLAFLSRKNWLEKGRVPFITKRRHANKGESRVWAAVLSRVLKRPALSTALAGGLLVALTIPALGMQLKNPGFDGYSRSQPVIQTQDRLQAAFPGGAVPAMTVIKADDVTAAPVHSAIEQLHDRALATGRLSEPSHVEISPDKTVAVVALSVAGSGTDAASERSLETLRSEVVPATVGKLPGAEVAVTGVTAGSKDFLDAMTARAPLVFAFVLTLAFILLLVTFRSIVVPIKAIVLNLLSAGAAYGILVLVFQHGLGEQLLDFQSVGGVAPVIPLFLFVILFGLSMDYHVFILSRVREAVNGGMSNDEAVAHGLKSTAGVVTSAALVMVAVFGSFALASDQLAKQIGVGLAAAILIDATIIRAVLLPATMKLLGERNWYLPQRLGWLPTVEPSAV